MQPNSLEKRVEIVERTMDGLSELPTRVRSIDEQILQLRAETRAEFATVRSEASGFREELYAFRQEMRDEFVQVRAEIKAGDEETRVQMRVLHEEALGQIRLVTEGVDQNGQRLDALPATMVTKGELQAFRADVTARLADLAVFQKDVTTRLSDLAKFQKDSTALLSDIATRLPRRRPANRR